MKPATLKVLPNPFFALDANGMPAGMCRWDPDVGRPGAVEFIGVTVARAVDKSKGRTLPGIRLFLHAGGAGGGASERNRANPRRPLSLTYAQAPVEIPATAMHIEYVRTGALLAADQPTARTCRIWFVPPAQALEQAKNKAVAEWMATHDEGPPVEQWDVAVKAAQAPAKAANKPASAPQEPYFASPFAPAPAAAAQEKVS